MSIPKFNVVGVVLASLLLSASGLWLSPGNRLKAQTEEAKDSKVRVLLEEKLSILRTIAALHWTERVSWRMLERSARDTRDKSVCFPSKLTLRRQGAKLGSPALIGRSLNQAFFHLAEIDDNANQA